MTASDWMIFIGFLSFVSFLLHMVTADRVVKRGVFKESLKSPSVRCMSFSCGHNKGGECTSEQIVVYDNGVIGLCLQHTGTMHDRILEPLQKGMKIGQKAGESDAFGLIAKALEDTEEDRRLLIDKNAFERWLKGKLDK